MDRWLIRVVAVLLAVPLAASRPVSAEAASYGHVWVPDGILWPACLERMAVAHYALTPPTNSWSAEFFLYGPGGRPLASNAVDSDSDPLSGTRPFGVCGASTTYGWFTVRTRLTYYDASHPNGTEAWLPIARFHLGKPHTRTNLLTPHHARSWRQTRGGYRPNGYQWVAVQVLRSGSWHTVRRLATGPRGYVSFRTAPGHRVRVRTLARAGYRPSVSRALVA